MSNILILADLTSPLMGPRIAMLKELPYTKYLLHNANNAPINQSQYHQFEGFVVLTHPFIKSTTLRYGYSFCYTLFLLLKLRPKCIIVHWASRLYQNILLTLWGGRVIVHTMGGEINPQEDCHGKKKFFTSLLFWRAKLITGKTEVMRDILRQNFPFVQEEKIKILSFGVEERFFAPPSQAQKAELKRKLLGKDYQWVFFSIRTFKRVHEHKEILKQFIAHFGETQDACLILSSLSAEQDYWQECQEELNLERYGHIIFANIPHQKMHQYLHISNAILSLKRFDGISQSIMEAVCAGVFVIAYDIQNHAMILEHQQNAYLIQEPSELGEAFEFVCKHRIQKKNFAMLHYQSQKAHYLKLLEENFHV